MEYGVVTDQAQENTADANLYEHTENVYENTEYVYDPITTQVPYEYKSDVAQTGMSDPNHTRNIYFSFIKEVYWKSFLYNSHLFYSQ